MIRKILYVLGFLFLAALVLFMMTFLFNTLAELVRQRLREKYSSL